MEYKIGDTVNGWVLLKILPRFNIWGRRIRYTNGVADDTCMIRECFYPYEMPTTKYMEY